MTTKNILLQEVMKLRECHVTVIQNESIFRYTKRRIQSKGTSSSESRNERKYKKRNSSDQ